MTPSEIAEVYGMGDLPTNGLLLEVISKQAEALKIATEALEEIGSEQDMKDNKEKPLGVRIALDLTARIERANEALARIKGVG